MSNIYRPLTNRGDVRDEEREGRLLYHLPDRFPHRKRKSLRWGYLEKRLGNAGERTERTTNLYRL